MQLAINNKFKSCDEGFQILHSSGVAAIILPGNIIRLEKNPAHAGLFTRLNAFSIAFSGKTLTRETFSKMVSNGK
jgi:hypothetical protein